MDIHTARLILRRPTGADAQAIFDVYASDPAVTRYLSWPTHDELQDTKAFLEFADAHWQQWHTGPLLIERKDNGALIGGSGLTFEDSGRVSTGYCFARSAWGQGYASESLAAMVSLARDLKLSSLAAICHHEHRASAHVLEKQGFIQQGVLPNHTLFINLDPETPADVLLYQHGLS